MPWLNNNIKQNGYNKRTSTGTHEVYDTDRWENLFNSSQKLAFPIFNSRSIHFYQSWSFIQWWNRSTAHCRWIGQRLAENLCKSIFNIFHMFTCLKYETWDKILLSSGICKATQECNSFAERQAYQQHEEPSGVDVFAIAALCGGN